MKKIFLLLLSSIVINSFAHDCGIDAWIEDNYLEDAKILALREIYDNPDNAYADSVVIPAALINKYLSALYSVYLRGDDVADSIFHIYNIYALPNVPYMGISMLVDTNIFDIKELLADSVFSGNPQFDSIMVNYDFKLQSFISIDTCDFLFITTSQYLNLKPLVHSLNSIDGLDYAEANLSMAGDGYNIEYSMRNDTAFLDFSIAWGDCPSGCIYRQYWKFSIYDCNATFLGVTGDNYASAEQINKNGFNVYPNPVRNFLTIEEWFEIERIGIYDLQGKLIVNYDEVSEHLDLSELKLGIYILNVLYRNNVMESVKIIKR